LPIQWKELQKGWLFFEKMISYFFDFVNTALFSVFPLFRLRVAQLHLRQSRNIIGRKPTSFVPTAQHRSFVSARGRMMLAFG